MQSKIEIKQVANIILGTLAECPEGASESIVWLGINNTGLNLDEFQSLMSVFEENKLISNRQHWIRPTQKLIKMYDTAKNNLEVKNAN